MTLRLPDDLPELKALAVEVGLALAMVYHVEPLGEHWEGPELPIVRVEVNPESEYIEFITMPDASEASLKRALSFADVVTRLERFAEGGEVRQLFWVSGLRPLAPENVPEDSDCAIRLALPFVAIAHATEPTRVAFVARRTA
jgi:hypothetical protein